MMSVMQAVREEVEKDHRLKDALCMDIANYRKISKLLQPKISKKTGKAGIDAISMAIIRLQKQLRPEERKHAGILRESQINLRDNIQVNYLRPDAQTTEPIFKSLQERRRSFYVKIAGTDTSTVIMDSQTWKKTRIPSESVIDTKKNLTAITVVSPPEIINTPGVIAEIITALVVSSNLAGK